ncbi:MAG: hypothetical protein IKP95_11280, partial [Ruminococcus sp.]|nr:hypothetical protein [Ruminococcus sp.]
PRLAPLHVICLHIFRHSTQIFLAGRQPAFVKFMHSDEKSDCASDAQGLCGIAYVSSTGVRVLMNAVQKMEEKGGVFLRNVVPEVMNVFRMIGIGDDLIIEE